MGQTLGNAIKSFDAFSQPVGFSRNKKHIYSHWCASIVKILIFAIVVGFLIVMIIEPIEPETKADVTTKTTNGPARRQLNQAQDPVLYDGGTPLTIYSDIDVGLDYALEEWDEVDSAITSTREILPFQSGFNMAFGLNKPYDANLYAPLNALYANSATLGYSEAVSGAASMFPESLTDEFNANSLDSCLCIDNNADISIKGNQASSSTYFLSVILSNAAGEDCSHQNGYWDGISMTIFSVDGYYLPFQNPSVGYRLKKTKYYSSSWDSSEAYLTIKETMITAYDGRVEKFYSLERKTYSNVYKDDTYSFFFMFQAHDTM